METSSTSKKKTVALWVITVLAGAFIAFAGFSKLSVPVTWTANFAHMGYPGAMAYLIGTLELVGGVLLLSPALAPYAAAVLSGVMAGATVTHVVLGDVGHAPVPFALLVFFVIIGWARRPAWVVRRLRMPRTHGTLTPAVAGE